MDNFKDKVKADAEYFDTHRIDLDEGVDETVEIRRLGSRLSLRVENETMAKLHATAKRERVGITTMARELIERGLNGGVTQIQTGGVKVHSTGGSITVSGAKSHGDGYFIVPTEAADIFASAMEHWLGLILDRGTRDNRIGFINRDGDSDAIKEWLDQYRRDTVDTPH